MNAETPTDREEQRQSSLVTWAFGATALATLLVSCDDFSPTTVTFTQEDIVTVGDVHTLEVAGRVISSLPETAPTVDPLRAALGRDLFWDPLLSGNRDVACATCHLPEHGYTDGQFQSIGVGGTGRGDERVVGHGGRVKRNSQTVLNSAWNGINSVGLFDPSAAPMFWDNRVESLEAQALEPIRSREEMRGDGFTQTQIDAEIVTRLNANASYAQAFNDAFGTATISTSEVAQALANFQRTLIANNTPFDRWMRGEPNAMTARELSGMLEFAASGCADCHSGPLFSDFRLRVLGAPEGQNLSEPDSGNGNFAFRTPTLRQLDFTAPYFHAGQFATLAEATNFYDERRSSANPNVPSSALAQELLLSPSMEDGRGALIQDFLKTLNDDTFDQTEPSSVPSGLRPGGFTP